MSVSSLVGQVTNGAITSAISSITGAQTSVLLLSNRNIGGIIPNVTISEEHTDTLTLTKHPVQLGASITDHAYVNPAQLTMIVAWSDSGTLEQPLVSGELFTSPITSVVDLYNGMLTLQASRVLLNVITGKRQYNNMLISKLETTTNEDTEYALILIVTMEQLIVVDIQGASTPTSGQIGSPVNQESPQDTSPPVLAGVQQAISNVSQTVVTKLAATIPGIPTSLGGISLGAL